jgi:hypothetical protein
MRGYRLLASLLVVAATWGLSSPASAQCRLCGTATTARPESVDSADVKLEIQASLNFDRLILDGAGDGIAVIRPDGSTSATGALSNVGPRAMVGTVAVHGEPGRFVRVDIPQRIELYSLNGGRMTFDEVQSDLSSAPRLDSAGNLTFRFGGRVRVSGDSEGDYRGDLPITVEYQ